MIHPSRDGHAQPAAVHAPPRELTTPGGDRPAAARLGLTDIAGTMGALTLGALTLAAAAAGAVWLFTTRARRG